MIGFLGGSRSKDNGSDERQGLAAGAMQPAPSTLPPAMPPVHTLAPQQMPNADANPQPRRTTPPPLPRHLSELMALPPPAMVPASAAPLSAARAAIVAALENPGPPDAATTPTQTYQLVRTLYDAREAVSLELAAMAKEYQVLKSLQESDLDLCQDLVGELTRRLEPHPLYQCLGKLNEAYALALRFRRPPG